MTSAGENHVSVANEVKTAVRSNLIAAAASGIAGGVVAASLAAWALVATLPGKVGLTPAGAVMAFDLKGGCPSGWQPYYKGAGRFIIGAAGEVEIDNIPGDFTVDKSGNRISQRGFGKSGGRQSHEINIEQMPKHNHDSAIGVGPGTTLGNRFPIDGTQKQTVYGTKEGPAVSVMTAYAGKEKPEPIDILPPYVALYFCTKN
ncbi:hypothetical protein [Methylobacterium sp. CM6244]